MDKLPVDEDSGLAWEWSGDKFMGFNAQWRINGACESADSSGFALLLNSLNPVEVCSESNWAVTEDSLLEGAVNFWMLDALNGAWSVRNVFGFPKLYYSTIHELENSLIIFS